MLSSATHRRLLLTALVVPLLVVAACGGDDDASESADRPTTTASTPSTTASDAGAAVDLDGWQANATSLRDDVGSTHEVDCPPDGQAYTVWGAGTYTDDSSICTAAVQSGLITFSEGGTVTFEVAPGEDAYEGGTANGVTSLAYGSWDGSFTFPDAPPGSIDFAVGPESWGIRMTEERGEDGKKIPVECSPGGTPGSVWGSDPYTDDSSVCTAAVHAGLITVAEGGTVVVEIAPGASSYSGSEANGITSLDFGPYDGSFTFPDDQTAR